MGNEKDAQIQLIEQTIDQLNIEAGDIDKALDDSKTKINPIVADRDSNWIAQYGTDYNSVAECVSKAAGEVRTTANTLKKIIQEMLREDTAK